MLREVSERAEAEKSICTHAHARHTGLGAEKLAMFEKMKAAGGFANERPEGRPGEGGEKCPCEFGGDGRAGRS